MLTQRLRVLSRQHEDEKTHPNLPPHPRLPAFRFVSQAAMEEEREWRENYGADEHNSGGEEAGERTGRRVLPDCGRLQEEAAGLGETKLWSFLIRLKKGHTFHHGCISWPPFLLKTQSHRVTFFLFERGACNFPGRGGGGGRWGH